MFLSFKNSLTAWESTNILYTISIVGEISSKYCIRDNTRKPTVSSVKLIRKENFKCCNAINFFSKANLHVWFACGVKK